MSREQRPAQPRQAQPHEAAARQDVPAEHRRGQRRGEHHRRRRRRRCRAPGSGPRPKISSGESGTSSTTPTQIGERRHQHVAGAADHAGERVHQPDQHGAGEHDVGIAQRRLERAALAAQRRDRATARTPAPARRRPGPSATLMISACSTSASASSRRPAPSARAIAEEMPPPIAPADSICIIMKPGNTSAMPASASVPRRDDPPGLDQPGRGLRQHHQDVRPGHAQQRRHDRRRAAAGACAGSSPRGGRGGAARRHGGGDGGHGASLPRPRRAGARRACACARRRGRGGDRR